MDLKGLAGLGFHPLAVDVALIRLQETLVIELVRMSAITYRTLN
jgi:hypothetical protein